MQNDSKIYQLYEMQKACSDSINTCAEINEKYSYLIELVKANGDPEKLPDDLIDGLQSDLDGTNAKIPNIQRRLDYCNELIEILDKHDEESDKLEQLICKIFVVFGIERE